MPNASAPVFADSEAQTSPLHIWQGCRPRHQVLEWWNLKSTAIGLSNASRLWSMTNIAILHARCPSKTYLNHVYHRVYPPAIRHPIKHGEMLRAYSWMMIQCFHMFPPSKVRMFQPFLQNLQKTREPSGLLQLRHTVRQKVRTTSRPVSSAKEQTWGFSDLIGFQYVQWENPWFPANEPLNFALNPSNDQFWNRKSIRTPRPWRLICNPPALVVGVWCYLSNKAMALQKAKDMAGLPLTTW